MTAFVDDAGLESLLTAGILGERGALIGADRSSLRLPERTLVLGHSQYARLLGSSIDYVVYDARVYYDPNSLAASADSVRGGGVFVVLGSTLNKPVYRPIAEDSFRGVLIERFRRFVSESHFYVSLESGKTELDVARAELPRPSVPKDRRFLTNDEQRIFSEILNWLSGNSPRGLLLFSRRGRGKSAILGMALAAHLASHSGESVQLTSSASSNLETLLYHFQRSQGHPERSSKGETGGESKERETPLQTVAASRVRADSLVVVDEASSVQLNQLLEIAGKASRFIFSTTTYGYEGSGRSFQIRLQSRLRERRIATAELTMSQPVRYSEDDPLEWALSETFYFEHSRGSDGSMLPLLGLSAEYKELSPSELATLGDDQLGAIYRVLTESHYRNEPRDLGYILEYRKGRTAALFLGETPVAVAWLVSDGPISVQQVRAARRGGSLPGDLISERMAVRTRIAGAGSHSGVRISRIAVLPDLQKRGLGTSLLQNIEVNHTGKLDWIGASFAAEPDVCSFWAKSGYRFVGLSWRAPAFAEYPSAFCVKPLSPAFAQWLEEAAPEFREHMLTLLPTTTVPESALAVMLSTLADVSPPGEKDLESLEEFVSWDVPVELVLPSLRRCTFKLARDLQKRELGLLVGALRRKLSASEEKTLKKSVARVLGKIYHG